MARIPGLHQFNGQIGRLKREAQKMRETLNLQQEVHERKQQRNKAYRISKEAKHFDLLLHEVNDLVEAIEKLRPAGHQWDIRYGELVLFYEKDSDEE